MAAAVALILARDGCLPGHIGPLAHTGQGIILPQNPDDRLPAAIAGRKCRIHVGQVGLYLKALLLKQGGQQLTGAMLLKFDLGKLPQLLIDAGYQVRILLFHTD